MELTKEFIVWFIRAYEMEHSEDFFDQDEIHINSLTFMTWCYGKGYLTKEQYDEWSDYYGSKDIVEKLYATCANHYIYNCHSSSEYSFAIVTSEDYKEEDYLKALYIFAEFVIASKTYTNRMIKVVEDSEVDIGEYPMQ